MKEQEAMLMAKYGGMKPKKKPGALGAAKVRVVDALARSHQPATKQRARSRTD